MKPDPENHSEQEPPSSDSMHSRSWFGYGLITFCSSFLIAGVCELLQGVGMRMADTTKHMIFVIPVLLSFLFFGWGLASRLVGGTKHRKVETRQRKRYSRIAGLLLLGGFLAVMVADCRLRTGEKSLIDSAHLQATREWGQRRVQGLPIVFEVPSTYLPTHEPNHGFLSLLDRSRSTRIVVFALPRADFAFESLQQAAETTRQQWLLQVPDSSFKSMEMIGGGKHPVIRQVLENVDNGVLLYTRMEHHDLGDHWVELRFVATPRQFALCEDEFQKVSASLALLP